MPNDNLLDQYADMEPTDNMDLNIQPIEPDNLADWKDSTPFTSQEYTGHFRDKNVKYDEGISYADATSAQGFEKQRHKEQGAMAQLGSALNQAIVGEIAGGTIEGIGYLLDIPQYANLIKGSEVEFGNWLSGIGTNMKEWSREATPIYSDPFKEGEFAPEDWSWWMSNLPSVASTLSLMIPSGAAVKGMSMGAKALGMGAKMTNSAKWAAKGVSQAVISRHMENMMEAAGTMDGIKKELSGQIVGEKQADYINKNYGIQLDKEGDFYKVSDEAANAIGAKAASSTYNQNWAMLLQDIPQYLMLRTPFGKASKDITGSMSKLLGVSNVKPIVNKTASIVSDMLGEGAEEGYQFLVGERARENALVDAGLMDKRDMSKFLGEETSKGEFWTSAFFGAMGAGVMQTAGKPISNAIDRIKGVETDEQSRINNIQSWGNDLKMYSANRAIGNALNNKDMQDAADENILAGMTIRAAQNGNIDAMKMAFEEVANMSEEEQKKLGMTPEDVKAAKDRNPELMKDIDRVVELFESASKVHGPKWGSKIASLMYQMEKVDKSTDEYNKIYNSASSDIVNMNKVSGAKSESYKLTNFEIPALQSFRNDLTKLYNETKDDGLKSEYRERLEEIDNDIFEKKDKASELLKNRSDEEKASDKKFKLYAPKNDVAKSSLISKISNQERRTSINNELNKATSPEFQKKSDNALAAKEKEAVKSKVNEAETPEEVRNVVNQTKGTQHESTANSAINKSAAAETVDNNSVNQEAALQRAQQNGSKLSGKKASKSSVLGEQATEPAAVPTIEKKAVSDKAAASAHSTEEGYLGWLNNSPKALVSASNGVAGILNKYDNEDISGIQEHLKNNINSAEDLARVIDDLLGDEDMPIEVEEAVDDLVVYLNNLDDKRDLLIKDSADKQNREQPEPTVQNPIDEDNLVGSTVELNDGTKGRVESTTAKKVKIRTDDGTVVSKNKTEVSADVINATEEKANLDGNQKRDVRFKSTKETDFIAVNQKKYDKSIDNDGLNSGEYKVGDVVYFEVDPNNEYKKDSITERKIFIVTYKDGKRSVIGLVRASTDSNNMLSIREQIFNDLNNDGIKLRNGNIQSNYSSTIGGFIGEMARSKTRISALEAAPKSEKEKNKKIGGFKLAYTKSLTKAQRAWKIPKEKSTTTMHTGVKHEGMISMMIQDVFGTKEYIPIYGYVKKMREFAGLSEEHKQLVNQLYKTVTDIAVKYNGKNGKEIHSEIARYIILPGKVNLSDVMPTGKPTDAWLDLFQSSIFNIDANKMNSVVEESHDLGFNTPIDGLYNAVISDMLSFNTNKGAFFTGVGAMINDSLVTNGKKSELAGETATKSEPTVEVDDDIELEFFSKKDSHKIIKNSTADNEKYLGKLINSEKVIVSGGVFNQDTYVNAVIQNITTDDGSSVSRLLGTDGKTFGQPLFSVVIDSDQLGSIFDNDGNIVGGEAEITEFINNKLKDTKPEVKVEPIEHMTMEQLIALERSTDEVAKEPVVEKTEPAVEGKTDGTPIKPKRRKPKKIATPINDAGLDKLKDTASKNRRRKKSPVASEIENYTKWDRKTEVEWFKKNFPNVPIQVLDNLKEVTKNGKELWGVFQNASIYIANNAGVGTVYHEAFHAVFNLFLDEKQANDMLSLHAKTSGLKEPKNESDRIAIEEDLADQFADYVISDGLDNSPSNKINKFFRGLWLTIKSFFTNEITSVDELFFRANNGFYTKSRVKPGAFGSEVVRTRIPDWKQAQTKEAIESITNHIVINILPSIKAENIDYNDYSTAEMFGVVMEKYNSIDPLFHAVNNHLLEIAEESDEETQDRIYETLNELINEDDSIGNLGRDVIRALDYYNGIKVSAKVIDAYDESDKQDDIEKNDEQGMKENWQDSFMNRSRKLNAPAEIKEFIRYIPTGEKNIIGLDAYIGYEDAYNTLLDKMSNATSLQDMRNVLYNNVNVYPFYSLLIERIDNDLMFSTKFFNAFNSQKMTYGMLNENEGVYTYSIVNRGGTVNKVIARWANDVNDMSNKEAADKVKAELETYASKKEINIDDLKNIESLTKSVGLHIPLEALNRANMHGDLMNMLFGNYSVKYIVNKLSEGNNPFDSATIHGEGKAIKKLAEFVVEAMPNLTDNSFTNIDGETMHSYVVPNFLSKLMSRLHDPNKVESVIADLKRDPIFQNNVILNELLNNASDLDSLKEVFNVHILNGVRSEGGAFSHQTMNEAQRTATSLNLYFNSNNQRYSMYEGPVLSDAPNMLLFKFKRFTESESIRELIKLAESEYQSIQDRKAWSGDKIEFFDTKDYNYQMMPMMNALQGSPLKNYEKAEKLIKKFIDARTKELHSDLIKNKVVTYGKEVEKGSKFKVVKESMLSKDMKIKDSEDMHKLLTGYYRNNLLVRTHFSLLTVGDPAFYKPDKKSETGNRTVDYTKRAKEIYSPKFIPDLDAVYYEEVFDKDGNLLGRRPFTVNAEYKTIYLRDAEIKAPSYDGLDASLESAVKGGFMSPKQKSDILKRYDSGRVNQTDAQAYITLPFYRETMISLGRWTDKHQRAFHRLTRSKGTANDIALVMQPLKPFVYGMMYNEERGKMIPVQNKNSEYLLLPQLVDNNEQLKDIHDFMMDEGVGTANFESAVKVGLSKVVPFNKETGKLDLSADNVHLLNMEDRGIQMETPEHFIDGDNLFGTQIRKLIMADLIEGVDYTSQDGALSKRAKDLQKLYEEILLADLTESYENAKTEFLNEDGTISNKKIGNLLRDEARSRGKGEEFERAIEVTNGEFNLVLFDPLYGKMIQSLINSVFRSRVTKQKIKGGAMIQATSFGLSKELKLVFKEDGGLDYGEVLLPSWSKDFFQDFTDENGNVDFEKAQKELPPEVFDMVGYRIPTEDKYSMLPLKVVGFLPLEAGGAIMLPAEITTISGSDFDVDKMYIMMREYDRIEFPDFMKIKNELSAVGMNTTVKEVREIFRKLKVADKADREDTEIAKEDDFTTRESEIYAEMSNFSDNTNKSIRSYKYKSVKYNWKKSASEQSKQARNNAKLDIMESILTNKATLASLFTPGGFDHIKDNVVPMILSKLIGKGREDVVMDILTAHKMANQNMAGKSLVGIGANHNAHNAIRQMAHLTIEPILFDGITDANLLSKNINGGFKARTEYTLVDGKVVKVDNPDRTITKNISEFLAAIVDNAKDPLVSYLNYNDVTSDTYSLIISAGFDTMTTAAFMTQPIVVEFVDIVKSGKTDAEAFAELSKILGTTVTKSSYDNLETTDLVKSIGSTDLKTDLQSKVAIAFYNYYMTGKDLNKLIGASRADTKGLGATVAHGEIILDSIDEILTSKFRIEGAKELVQGTGENTKFIDMFTEYGVRLPINEVLNQVFPYSKGLFKDVKDILNDVNPSGFQMTADQRNLVNDKIINYALSSFDYFNADDRAYFIEEFPKQLMKKIRTNPELQEHDFLKRFNIKIAEYSKSGLDELSIESGGSISNEMRVDMQKSFEDLFNDPKYSKLAHNLVKYSYFTSGLNFTPNGYSQFIPVEARINNIKDSKGNNITNHIKGLLTGEYTGSQSLEFRDQFYRNMYYDKRFVPQITEESHLPKEARVYNKKKLVGFEINPDQYNPAMIATKGEKIPAEYVYVKTKEVKQLFKRVGENGNGIRYESIDTLGRKNYLYETVEGMGSNMESAVGSETDNVVASSAIRVPITDINDTGMESTNQDIDSLIAAAEANKGASKIGKKSAVPSKKDAKDVNKKCGGSK